MITTEDLLVLADALVESPHILSADIADPDNPPHRPLIAVETTAGDRYLLTVAKVPQ